MSLTLIDNVLNGSIKLSEMTKEELTNLHRVSVANGDFRALKIATNNVTGIYNYNERQPYWLLNNFFDPVWYIEIKNGDKRPFCKTIEWDSVILNDGLKLTDTKHIPLLNGFKYWVTATDNPLENSGKLRKGHTVYQSILKVISLINALLIYGENINISTRHLSGLSDDFLMAVMVKLAEEGDTTNGIYDYTNQVKKYLKQHILLIDGIESAQFADEHPYITRLLLNEEQLLGFSTTERVKACYWLNTVGYYTSQLKSGKLSQKPQGNSNILFWQFYKGKVIPFDFSAECIEELKLSDKVEQTEFRPIPNRDVSEGMGKEAIKQYLHSLKLLNVVHGKKGVSQFSPRTMKRLTTKRISEHVKLKKVGRYKTLPPRLVFDLIRDCYDFTKLNLDVILSSVLSVLKEAATKSTGKNSNPNYIYEGCKGHNPEEPRTERAAWVKKEALNFIDSTLLDMGVQCISVSARDVNRFKKRRNNEGMFDLFGVLIGSIQTLTGVIMAKRQDELSSLTSHGNLSPNIDPGSKEGKKTDYHLIAKLKKSGNGGKHGQNTTIKRPIPRSFALIIWKLEQFNIAAANSGICKNTLSLFPNLNKKTYQLEKIDQNLYNNYLDLVCDYFETPLVECEDDELRRYYIRQHQLRRFFAMVFFWSKGFDHAGMETLRWMLGHTDIQHLYHYITESETGRVLNGIKASYIVDELGKQQLHDIQGLSEVLEKRYGVLKENISISTFTAAIEDYENTDDYQTIPHIDELKKREKLESQILELLEDEVITLEPDFFTIEKDGNKINDFTLILQVKELD
ncbi:integrase [Vibrio sp.]|uniref:integrase n=1 Tax=Vibrio sp. TaxID=678 RepID=UPI00311E2732